MTSNRIEIQRARELRQTMTKAESLLWSHLRDRQLGGKKFRRQHVYGQYILDFYCHEQKLVIEIDGLVHQTSKCISRDASKMEALNNAGIVVLRFTNKEVFEILDQVLNKIKNTIAGKSR